MRATALPRPLQCAALAAVLLHGALAIALASRTTGLAGQVGAPPAAHNAGLQVRLLATQALQAVAAVTTPTPDAPSVALTSTAVAAPSTSAEPDDASDDPDLNGEHGEAAVPTYFGREDLDASPKALGLVQIGYPPGVPDNELQAGRLTLFIDEHGTVQRILVLDQSLPPPFQEAARNAFLQTRFAPGERAGRVVRSRIDVEVVFDARQTRVVGKQPVRSPAPT